MQSSIYFYYSISIVDKSGKKKEDMSSHIQLTYRREEGYSYSDDITQQNSYSYTDALHTVYIKTEPRYLYPSVQPIGRGYRQDLCPPKTPFLPERLQQDSRSSLSQRLTAVIAKNINIPITKYNVKLLNATD